MSHPFARFVLILACSYLSILSAANTWAAERPNVVVFLSDDQGWGDLSLNGNKNLSTPNIDSLARDGAMFDRFFVCPVCSPTRAEFLTGRYHPRGGVWGVSTGGERLDLDESTIGETFQKAGYATAAFGKWHNGMQYPYHPNARGFAEYFGFCSGHWGDYFSPPLEHNGKQVKGNGYVTDDFTDHAIQFIEDHRDKPFFCYVPFNSPHSPMQVPERFFEKFRNAELEMRATGPEREDLEFTRAALAMCENIDWNVGRVLRKLDALQLAEKTIVLYFCDNGPNSWRWNGGMKGRKGSTDEGGVRSPLVIRWPGHIPAGAKITQIAGAIDLRPTLAELAGIPVGNDPAKPLDGMSLAGLLVGEKNASPSDRMIFSHWNGKVSVRTQQFRLDDRGKLFDIARDAGQTRDVSADHPEVAARLTAEVTKWRNELLPGLAKDRRPFSVGYAQFPATFLPARDGVPHGNVQRSARAPNCSFFTNWTSPDDAIIWNIEVATAGKYRAVIYYTCASENVGSTIHLEFEGKSIEHKVTTAHDPPLRGKENDRVDRGPESYVKDFKPLEIGEIELLAKQGLLKLRASDIPGKQVIDVRAIELTLIQ